MKRKTILVILLVVALLILPCFPIGRFVIVHLRQGYDDAEREAATRPAAAPSRSTEDDHPAPSKPPSVEFGKLDFSQNSTDVHSRADHFVEKLPPLHGSGKNGFREGMVGQGKFEVRGGVAWMSGAFSQWLPSASHAGGLVHLEVVAATGTVRAYLEGISGSFISGYVFVDASPGHPGRVTGYLEDWSDTGTPEQTFVLESSNGDAQGVSYRVYRAE
jgi:hypothetical protein